MGETATFRAEDKVAIPVAIVLHAALVAVLVYQPVPDASFTGPERMSVSLASKVSLEATAPDPSPESRASIAPQLSDEVTPPVEEVPDTQAPRVVSEQPTTRESPPRDRSRPDREQPRRAARRGGGSRIGEDFLSGQGSSTNTDRTSAPAATFGRTERAALASAITRQLRPHWNAPNGVDAEKLVSIVSWKLNKDGSLSGRPTCRNEPGSITESNRPQAGLHCERAIRAVQLAAPFNLPEQFYSRWDDLEWQFDRRL
ncbi:energy transducer TonB [Erythrobacter sp. THAF29]|uniref:energy transducer TonB n=1 Tax=Erythrobacter sp. THAF29 TaxID=2587851 RepID=UPI0012686A00|nr:energy transducer TonB [Erythrobacter sp. THAF29]QFT78759.1 hypothetical protein FIU90_14510 [Erythrobacter sp. THAF29]